MKFNLLDKNNSAMLNNLVYQNLTFSKKQAKVKLLVPPIELADVLNSLENIEQITFDETDKLQLFVRFTDYEFNADGSPILITIIFNIINTVVD